jgi:hypothetical protein
MARRRVDDPVRITSAARSRSEDIRGRERRYIQSMGVRTSCFLLAVAFREHWVVWVFLAAAVFLPYVAVVMANTRSAPEPEASPFGFEADRKALTPPGRLGPGER